MKYTQLSRPEKKMYNKIIEIFLSSSIRRASWIRVLCVLINNYKIKEKKNVNKQNI